MNFKFVHAADLHLDSPLRGVKADGPLRALLSGSTFAALGRLVDLCLRERADFLLLAGDLFDAKDRSVRARLALRDALARLEGAGILTFVVHGNHDPLVPAAGALKLPSSVKVFGTAWEEVPVLREGAELCRIQGVSYGQERVTEDLSRHFRRTSPVFTVGLLHANVGSHASHAAYAPCSLADLAERDLDYWALGHVHTRAEHRLSSGGVAVYPGNLQGRHVLETGARGCVIVEVAEGRCQTRFAPLDVVRWHRLELSIRDIPTVDGVLDALEACLPDSEQEALTAHAVRVVLVGRGPLHSELQDADSLAQLSEHLATSLCRRPVPVVLELLEDRTEPTLDFAELEARGGLAAEVIGAARDDRNWTGEVLKPVESALRKAGLPPLGEVPSELFNDAMTRALELLVGEG